MNNTEKRIEKIDFIYDHIVDITNLLEYDMLMNYNQTKVSLKPFTLENIFSMLLSSNPVKQTETYHIFKHNMDLIYQSIKNYQMITSMIPQSETDILFDELMFKLMDHCKATDKKVIDAYKPLFQAKIMDNKKAHHNR